MTSREFYLERRKAELPAFLKVLRSFTPGTVSAYLRPMGGLVPVIYGPSADSRSKQAGS
jgi:hypothetical protein